MATFNYYLREPKSTKPTPIILFVQTQGKSKKIKTEQTIHPKYWDTAKQRIKSSFPGSTDINVLLSTYLLKAQKAFTNSLTDNERPSATTLRDKVHVPKEKPKTDVRSHFEGYIDALRPIREVNSIKKLISTFNQFKVFQDHARGFNTFQSLNQLFYDQFLTFLIETRGLNNNTAYKYIKVIKSFLQWSFDREIHNEISFKRFKVKEFPVDVIYLSERELFRIYNADLKFNPNLDLVRDAFCLACFTGQRFSDIHGLRWEDIRMNTWILHTKKTKETIEIPLNKFAIEILRKHKNSAQPVPSFSIQFMNEMIKDVAKLANVDESVKIIDYSGSHKTVKVYPKYELVSTHVARKTFVTLSLQKGMRPETVMEITGHKDFRTLRRYIKITSKVKETEMNQIWNKEVA